MLAQGGMSPHEALRAGTLNGAESLGLDRDIGSLTAGKLADLLVLDRNPLENLRNSTAIRQVMVNGRLYDAATLAQLGKADEATRAAEQVRRFSPMFDVENFGTRFADPGYAARLQEGLRKAGL